MKFKTKTKDCRLAVRVKTSFGESIDKNQLDKFARIYLRGFLKANLVRKNLVEYTGPTGIRLCDKLNQPISKRDFLLIMEQIVAAVQKLQNFHLPLNHLVLNHQYVYINEATKELQFIYLPLTDPKESANISEFIETIAYSAHPDHEKDRDYVSRFFYFFENLNSFDAGKIEAFIAKEDRSVVNLIRKQNIGQSGFMTNKQQHYYDHYNRKAGDEPTGLLTDEEATGLLDENEEVTGLPEEATGLLEQKEEASGLLLEEEATGLLDENDNRPGSAAVSDFDGGTALLEENQEVHYPTLLRILTEESISVNKPVFRLGKEKSYVDYFVTNNIAVSRSHADIITRGNRYYIKDLNSKNHTYINNREVPVHYEMEIFDGDTIKLANEEFLFQI